MSDKMLTVLNTRDPLQAEFMRGLLDANGLHPKLSNDRPGWTGRYSTLSRGIRLTVPQQEAARAKKLIQEADAGAFSMSDAELAKYAEAEGAPSADGPYAPTACPGCGSARIVKNAGRGVLFLCVNLLFLGLPWLFTPNTWTCLDCGWEWTRDSVADTFEKDRDEE